MVIAGVERRKAVDLFIESLPSAGFRACQRFYESDCQGQTSSVLIALAFLP